MSNSRDEAYLEARESKLFLQSVERAIRVIEAYSEKPRPLSLADIAAIAGIDKSGAQRICHTLHALGYLERDRGEQGFVPGKKFLDRSFDYLRLNPLVERATPILIELRKAVQERVDLSLLDDTSIVYAIRLQSRRETFFATLIGRRIPTFISSGGRAMLAKMSDPEVSDILRRSERKPISPKTVTSLTALWAKIREARERGYGLASEEGKLGEIVLGAAIVDVSGKPIAAIHIAGSLSDWKPDEFVKRMAPLAIEAAHALS